MVKRVYDLFKPAPPAHSINFQFWPWDEYTECKVVLRSLVDGVGREVVVWSGNLAVGRRGLAGRPPAECALLLSDHLYRRWHQSDTADGDSTAVGPGAPLGATGGTVPQDPLPGL